MNYNEILSKVDIAKKALLQERNLVRNAVFSAMGGVEHLSFPELNKYETPEVLMGVLEDDGVPVEFENAGDSRQDWGFITSVEKAEGNDVVVSGLHRNHKHFRISLFDDSDFRILNPEAVLQFVLNTRQHV